MSLLSSLVPARRRAIAERAERIASGIAPLLPTMSSLLDIGCGDGTLVKALARKASIRDFRGVDVKVQPHLDFDAQEYDGLRLPFADASFDAVTISDVLHHADSASAVFAEAMRVTKPAGSVIIKDHFRLGTWSNSVLLAMDVIGNYSQGIVVTGTYYSPVEWVDMAHASGAVLDKLVWPFHVHDYPFRVVTRSEYQFIARFVHRT